MREVTLRLGRLKLRYLQIGSLKFDGGALFGIIPRPLWSRVVQPDENNRVRVGVNVLLIEGEHYRVLLDTGLGDVNAKFPRRWIEIYEFESTPVYTVVPPDRVDFIVPCHLHFDHAGGLTRLEGDRWVPSFPNAKVIVHEKEWRAAHNPHELSRRAYYERDFDPVMEAELLVAFTGDEYVIDVGGGVVRVVLTGGHTDGHVACLIESEGATALWPGDVVPTPWHMDWPWIAAFDLYPLDTLRAKKRLLLAAAEKKWLVLFDHDPDMRYGFVKLDERGRPQLIASRETSF